MLRRLAPSVLRPSLLRRFSVEAQDIDSFRYVEVEQDERIGIVTLNRPTELNALNSVMTHELVTAAKMLDADKSVHALVISGSSRAFAAGLDVTEMIGGGGESGTGVGAGESEWMDELTTLKKPVIAAVSGFALGVGCELAMAADIVIADRDAKFGLPEITLGTHPGHGGTQRLIRAVGKAKAMEMILTGRQMHAEEAESSGLVSRLADSGRSREEAIDVAKVISNYSLPVVIKAKHCINNASELSLKSGILEERSSYQSTFKLRDFKEGIKAFNEQRQPEFKNK